jgi:type II secretory pathway pseudopilin PulG
MMYDLKPIAGFCQRRGFTLMEATIVSALMIFLAVVLSSAWSGFGRPLVDAVARSRVAQEASLAIASLARDWGGNTIDATGGQGQGRLVGRTIVSGSELWLCFDGGASPDGLPDWAPPDTVIIYDVQANKLVRSNQNAGTTFTVATDVQSLALTDLGNGVQIQLNLSFRAINRTYTMIAKDP